MLKHKKFLSLSFVLPFFLAFSCAKAKEPYNVHRQVEDEIEHLFVNDSNLPKSIKSGEKLPIDYLIVKYADQELTWLGENKEFEQPDKFFLVTNSSYPTNSIVTKLEVITNVERNDLTFYVAHFDKSEETVYVSRTLKITITNDDAIKPWVWYTVTAVVVFGVIGMVMFTRHYKAKKEGKI